MKGPPITVKCDCAEVRSIPYGDAWTCESCGRRWNTKQIPSTEYWGIMRRMRRYRFQVMGVAVAIAGVFVLLGLVVGHRFFLLAPIAVGFWFIAYMPRWRRKVRSAARSLPVWELTPE